MQTTFTKGGFSHRLIKREGQIAIFERRKPDGGQKHFEVVRIREHKAAEYEVGGAKIKREAGEHYPSSESWGTDGFTYNELSDAEKRFAEMTN